MKTHKFNSEFARLNILVALLVGAFFITGASRNALTQYQKAKVDIAYEQCIKVRTEVAFKKGIPEPERFAIGICASFYNVEEDLVLLP